MQSAGFERAKIRLTRFNYQSHLFIKFFKKKKKKETQGSAEIILACLASTDSRNSILIRYFVISAMFSLIERIASRVIVIRYMLQEAIVNQLYDMHNNMYLHINISKRVKKM